MDSALDSLRRPLDWAFDIGHKVWQGSDEPAEQLAVLATLSPNGVGTATMLVSDLPECPAGHVRVVCISDTHERHTSVMVPLGDVLIHAGRSTGGAIGTAGRYAGSLTRAGLFSAGFLDSLCY